MNIKAIMNAKAVVVLFSFILVACGGGSSDGGSENVPAEVLGLESGIHSDRLDLCEYFDEDMQSSYNGPHIVRVFDHGVDGGNFFFHGISDMAFVNCGSNEIKVSTTSGIEVTSILRPGQVEVTQLPDPGRHRFVQELNSIDLGDWRLS